MFANPFARFMNKSPSPLGAEYVLYRHDDGPRSAESRNDGSTPNKAFNPNGDRLDIDAMRTALSVIAETGAGTEELVGYVQTLRFDAGLGDTHARLILNAIETITQIDGQLE